MEERKVKLAKLMRAYDAGALSVETLDGMRAKLLPAEQRAKISSLDKAFKTGNLAEETYRKMKDKKFAEFFAEL